MLNLLIKDCRIALNNLGFTIRENSWWEKIKKTILDFNRWQKNSNPTQTFG